MAPCRAWGWRTRWAACCRSLRGEGSEQGLGCAIGGETRWREEEAVEEEGKEEAVGVTRAKRAEEKEEARAAIWAAVTRRRC